MQNCLFTHEFVVDFFQPQRISICVGVEFWPGKKYKRIAAGKIIPIRPKARCMT